MDFAGEEEEGAEEEAKDYGAEEVAVVHYVLIDAGEGVEDCEGLEGLVLSFSIDWRKRGSIKV